MSLYALPKAKSDSVSEAGVIGAFVRNTKGLRVFQLALPTATRDCIGVPVSHLQIALLSMSFIEQVLRLRDGKNWRKRRSVVR